MVNGSGLDFVAAGRAAAAKKKRKGKTGLDFVAAGRGKTFGTFGQQQETKQPRAQQQKVKISPSGEITISIPQQADLSSLLAGSGAASTAAVSGSATGLDFASKGSGSIQLPSIAGPKTTTKSTRATKQRATGEVTKQDLDEIIGGVKKLVKGGDSTLEGFGKRIAGKKNGKKKNGATPAKETTSGIAESVLMPEDDSPVSKSVPQEVTPIGTIKQKETTPNQAQGVLSKLRMRFGLR